MTASPQLRLLTIFAHPDDETLGTGGTLARYGAEGIETHVLTATRGEKGWFDEPSAYPGPERLGQIRETELHEAVGELGVRSVRLLDYIDGELDQAEPARVIGEIAAHIRRVRPHVVITFGPDGIYGHPDHIAISQFATAAVLASADPRCDAGAAGADGAPRPHTVAKLYYRVGTKGYLDAYEAAFGELVMDIDGEERRSQGWAPWQITTRIDTAAYWEQTWRAVEGHRSQLPGYQLLKDLPEEHHRNLWGVQEYYRALSLVGGGREIEDDLFAGLR
jgi:LmbE family N-acetylglucosaminyl deacetylase